MAVSTLQAAFRVRFCNRSDAELSLCIEPLGEHVTIPPRTTIECYCTEKLGHPNEFEMTEDGITVYGWVESVLAVSEEGKAQPLWTLPHE